MGFGLEDIEKRRHQAAQNKVEKVMKEFDRGALHSSSGAIVHDKKQALAIALSEARRNPYKR